MYHEACTNIRYRGKVKPRPLLGGKSMKKFSLIAILLCACLLLTACTATDPDNLFETPQGSTGSTAPSGTESTQTEPEEVILYTGTYQYGNMQKNIPSGNFMLLGNEVIFIRLASRNPLLYRYDLITEEVRPYCEDATCTHKDCVAKSVSNLEVYKGKLYALKESELEDRPGSIRQPVVLNGDKAEVILSSGGSFFHHEDKMYIKTADSSLVALEEGKKEPQMVLEECTGFWHMIFGNHLYSNKFTQLNTNEFDQKITRVDLTAEKPEEEVVVADTMGMIDGLHIYYVDQKTFQLYRCNMDGSDPQMIEQREVLDGSMNFDDEYFYYRLYTDQKMNGTADSCDLYRFPKEDPAQIEKIVTLPVSVHQVFTVPGTGKIFVQTIAPDGGHGSIYVMGTDGSEVKVLEIPEY